MPPSAGGGFGAADERRHRPGPGDDHAEVWTFLGAEPGHHGPVRVVVHLTWFAALDRVSFAAAVRLEEERAVLLVAPDLVTPRPGLELRGPGIWADHVVEEPFERWSLGLEAFGVAVDLPRAADLEVVLATSGTPELRGDRTALGWDLEWIATAVAEADGPDGYRVPALVEGELLVGHDDAVELDLVGEWRHRW